MPISLRATRTVTVVPILMAVAVLFGWQFRVNALKADMFGTFIAPNSALCFLLCGASILLQLSSSKVLHRLGVALGIMVATFALATMAEYIFGLEFGIDRIFFAHRLSDWKLPLPGRFAFNTSLAFAFAGVGLVTLRRTKGMPIAEISAGFVLMVFYLAMVGRVYSASILYSRVMSPYTAVLFGFLGTAMLCASAQHLFVDTALSKEAGGIVFRRMLVAILVLLPLIAWSRIQLERRGVLKAEVSTPLFVVITVSVFTVLTLHTANVLNQIDRRRKQTELALIRTEKLAAAGRMAATVAHEINNPLEAVTNLLFLIRNTNGNAGATSEYIRLAEQELARVAAITRRTLGFYREDTKPADLDLSKVAESVLELYAHRLNAANVRVNRSFGEGTVVRAPEGEMRQVFTNLLSNAFDALPKEQGRLDIATERVDDQVLFTFADNGRGIPQDHLERIFEPFFTTKRDVGNGLGLWVTKTLVEKNMGQIELESRTDDTDHGTIFRLKFPAAATALTDSTNNVSASD